MMILDGGLLHGPPCIIGQSTATYTPTFNARVCFNKHNYRRSYRLTY